MIQGESYLKVADYNSLVHLIGDDLTDHSLTECSGILSHLRYLLRRSALSRE